MVFFVWAWFINEFRSVDYVIDEFGIDYSVAKNNLQDEMDILVIQAKYDVGHITNQIPKYSKQTIKPMAEYLLFISSEDKKTQQDLVNYQL